MADARNWTAVAKTLHWLLALALFGALAGGFAIASAPPGDQPAMATIHAGAGIVVVVAMLARAAWRAVHPPPAPFGKAPAWAVRAARANHLLLYLVVFHQGIVGVWMAASARQDIWLFSTVNLGDLAPDNPALHAALQTQHVLGAAAFAVLVGLHLAGALAHQFVWKDQTLSRMLPGYSIMLKAHDETEYNRRRFPSKVKGFDWKRWRRA